MNITIRPAIEADQSTIVSMIRQAKINPRNLHWEHFRIAEEDGKVVGIRQVKVHKQGTREVASGFVLPQYRRRGISAQPMEIWEREKGALYRMCAKRRKKYYEPFGLRDVKLAELPSDFHREYLIGKVITTLISIVTLHNLNIIPMKRGG